MDDSQASIMDSRSEGLLGPAPNSFGSPDCGKRSNPFRSNQDVLHSLQQPQMLLHPNLPIPRSAPRPLLDIPTGFNNNRPFLSHHNTIMPDMDSPSNQQPNPFLLNNPRGLSPHVNQTHSPQMNYRNNSPAMRGNSPYFRNQKGPPMRGGYRPNFRGGNRNW